jgi:hypothetical protein
MTHTLHRRGDLESLAEDFVLLMMPAKGVNLDGSQEKMRQVWELLSRYEKDIVNYGNITTGNSHQIGIDDLKNHPSRLIHAVFKDPERLKACLAEIKERDFGLSVVVSGIYEKVSALCREIGLTPHTVEYSLGVHGRTDRLPPEDILEITTMCGHGLVSAQLVACMNQEIEAGRMSHEEASKELSRGCACGIFNPYRAENLLRRLAGEK